MTPSEIFSQLFDIGKDILSTALDATTNVVRAQIGDAVTGIVDSDAAAWWQHTGFTSRPAKAEAGKPACQGLVLKRGDRDIIFATRDTRGTAIYGKLKDGEACAYAPGFQSRTLWKEDGIWSITTDENDPGGTMFPLHQGTDGSLSFLGAGATIQAQADGSVVIGNSAAGISLGIDGTVRIFGQVVHVQASQLAMISGDVSTCVGPHAVPLNPATACAMGPGGPVNIVSTNVSISP